MVDFFFKKKKKKIILNLPSLKIIFQTAPWKPHGLQDRQELHSILIHVCYSNTLAIFTVLQNICVIKFLY